MKISEQVHEAARKWLAKRRGIATEHVTDVESEADHTDTYGWERWIEIHYIEIPTGRSRIARYDGGMSSFLDELDSLDEN